MTITISAEMEQTLKERAERLQTSVDDVVRRALDWYVSMAPELLEEFSQIEDAHAEALWLVEDSAP